VNPRLVCCVLGCWSWSRRYPESTEFICYRCWRLASKEARADRRALERRAKADDWPPEAEGLWRANWRRLTAEATEARAGV
jgi:hypothetical protein